MRLIDLDSIGGNIMTLENTVKRIKEAKVFVELNETEPIDKVTVFGKEYLPVVRCKDCKHRVTFNAGDLPIIFDVKGIIRSLCPYMIKDVSDNDFCSHGERKEE